MRVVVLVGCGVMMRWGTAQSVPLPPHHPQFWPVTPGPCLSALVRRCAPITGEEKRHGDQGKHTKPYHAWVDSGTHGNAAANMLNFFYPLLTFRKKRYLSTPPKKREKSN